MINFQHKNAKSSLLSMFLNQYNTHIGEASHKISVFAISLISALYKIDINDTPIFNPVKTTQYLCLPSCLIVSRINGY